MHPAPALSPENTAPYMAALNDAQRQAVAALDGPVLVLAGAGTGKTRVLTSRLVHLLQQGKARPHEILSVTFTNKAAREMKERVAHMLGRPVEGWWLGTFHALCARILRQHAELVGLSPTFTILDSDDQLRLIKQLLSANNIDEKQQPARMVLAVIQRWKDRGLVPAAVMTTEKNNLLMAKLYTEYQERLRTLNAADFGDLLLHNLTILQNNPAILESYQNRFRYILVDEYQDTNVAQYLWLRLLAQGYKNICCVGDDDQSIYGWRGAEVGNILRFESDFPGAIIVRLEENYRSTPHILAAASGVIAHNSGRLGKTLWTSADGGEKVRVRACWDGEDEARYIGDEIETYQRQKHNLSTMAILVRAGFQTREFEERFLKLGLPYKVVGGLRFYERQEIRDALAYFRLCHNQLDDLAFERIYNLPKRGLGDSALQNLHTTARTDQVHLFESALRLLSTDVFKSKQRSALNIFCDQIMRWHRCIASMPHTEWAQMVLDESGYTAMWQADKSPDAQGRLENLKELVSAMGEFDSLAAFLEHVSLVMDINENNDGDMVTIMTLHSAKGLEFETVFLPGWEEGLFPNQRSMDESGVAGLEEERRLAYVGITRARARACITYAASRRMYGSWNTATPSRFIAELPADHIDHDKQTYAHSGGGMGFGFAPKPRHKKNDFIDVDSDDMAYSPIAFKTIANAKKTSTLGFSNGDRVKHEKFGAGTVLLADQDKLDIQFDHAGRKRIMDRFVSAA